MKIGNRATITATYSDYYGLTGLITHEYPSNDPANYRFYVAFDQTELRKAKRPEVVLKSKSSTVYFSIKELELANVPA